MEIVRTFDGYNKVPTPGLYLAPVVWKNTEGQIMPCRDAMITNVITAHADQTVADALNLLEEHGITTVPIVDDNSTLVGLFSFAHLLLTILPMSFGDEGQAEGPMSRLHSMDISLDNLVETKPWVVNRLIRELPKKLGDTMVKSPPIVHPETPLREGVRLLAKYGSPLIVVDNGDKKLVGLVTYQNTLRALNRLVEKTLKENR